MSTRRPLRARPGSLLAAGVGLAAALTLALGLGAQAAPAAASVPAPDGVRPAASPARPAASPARLAAARGRAARLLAQELADAPPGAPVDAVPGTRAPLAVPRHGTGPGVRPLGGAGEFVSIPANYVYDPRLGTLHDYCSYAPDWFYVPGPDADFRGPCARHDQCYAGSTSKFTCDNRLWSDMVTNCDYTYRWWDPLRYECLKVANVYWVAVVVAP